jgi:SNF2 family DNA or RNA helicase
MVIDEAQYLRTRTTRRTVGIYGRNCDGKNALIECADRIWLLSGTICPNHVGELWPHYRAIFNGPLDYWPFLQRYTISIETPYGPKIVGNRNIAELRALLKSHVLRRRADQATGMPALVTSVAVVDPGKADLRALEEEFPELRQAIAAGDDKAVLALLEQASGGHLARLARLTGEAKVGPALELLTGELRSDPEYRIIVGFWHRAVGHALCAGLASFNSGLIDGATAPRARQQAIDDFQAGRARAIILQIAAAGVGIDLSRAGHVLLAEAAWSPAANAQLLARVVRPTQARPTVFGRYLALAGSLDEGIQAALERKARLLSEIKEIAA